MPSQWMRSLADNRTEQSLAHRFRRRRFGLFQKLVEDFAEPVRILDVGGDENYWRMMGIGANSGLQIVLVNNREIPTQLPNVSFVPGDATRMDAFDDDSFDIVFSNSVIEHLGFFEAQVSMADEIRRVGKAYFVQTPYKYFPVEPHHLIPYFQSLPVQLRVFLVRRFNLGFYHKIPDVEQALQHVLSHRLLTKPEMRALFPTATIHQERFLGLTKSLIAYKSRSR